MVEARRAAVLVGVASLALAVVPAVAAADSVTGELIRRLNRQLLYLAVPIVVLVELLLVYTVWRFHGGEKPRPTRENRQLEITWTVATALVLLFVGTASFHVLAHPAVSTTPDRAHGGAQPGQAPPDAAEVHVVTEQWNYAFEYPDANATAEDELVLPANRSVYLYVTSEDVIHSVHVPGLGLKGDAFPGRYHLIRTRLTGTGEYRLYCAEFCGEGHSNMTSTLRVVDQSAYQSWLDERRTDAGAGGDAPSNRTDER